MSLSVQNTNLISELLEYAETELSQRDKAQNLIARWNNNDVFNQLNDGDIQAIFSWLDKSKVSNGVNATTAILTALGDDVSGQAVNLIKLKG